MVFSFNLELICACKFFKKLKFQLFEKLTGANYINSKLDEKKPYIGVINKVWGLDGWILAKSFFFCVFMDLDSVSVHKLTEKERGQYPAILAEQTWSIKNLLYSFRGNFSCGTRWVVPSGQDSSILARSCSQSQHRIWFILPALGARHIIRLLIIWLSLTRTGNYQNNEFDWLRSILKAI